MSRSVIDCYLDDLSKQLSGTWWERRAILAELGDGLHEAAEYYRAQGFSLERSRAIAVEEFGGSAEIAEGFVAVLSGKQIRRYGCTFTAMGPTIGLLWGTAALLGSFSAVPRSLTILGLVMMALAVLVGVPGAVTAIASTGRASRFVRLSAQSAAKALLVTAAGAVFVDVTLLITLLTTIVEARRDLVVLPVTLGALVSVARISIAVTSVRRLESARALMAAD